MSIFSNIASRHNNRITSNDRMAGMYPIGWPFRKGSIEFVRSNTDSNKIHGEKNKLSYKSLFEKTGKLVVELNDVLMEDLRWIASGNIFRMFGKDENDVKSAWHVSWHKNHENGEKINAQTKNMYFYLMKELRCILRDYVVDVEHSLIPQRINTFTGECNNVKKAPWVWNADSDLDGLRTLIVEKCAYNLVKNALSGYNPRIQNIGGVPNAVIRPLDIKQTHHDSLMNVKHVISLEEMNEVFNQVVFLHHSRPNVYNGLKQVIMFGLNDRCTDYGEETHVISGESRKCRVSMPTKDTLARPYLNAVVIKYVRQMLEKDGKVWGDIPFTMINCNLNAFTNMHIDGKNASLSIIVNVGNYKEGDGNLWMSDPCGDELRELPPFEMDVTKTIPPMYEVGGYGRRGKSNDLPCYEGFVKPGDFFKGKVVDPRQHAIIFDGRDPHKTEPWLQSQKNLLVELAPDESSSASASSSSSSSSLTASCSDIGSVMSRKSVADVMPNDNLKEGFMRICIVCFYKSQPYPCSPGLKDIMVDKLGFPLESMLILPGNMEGRMKARSLGLLDKKNHYHG